MKILCKTSPDSKPFEIDYESFKDSISKGEITPGFLINDKIFTGGKWTNVDNCGIFHKLSPVKYPHGEILKREDETKARITEAKREISELQRSYLYGDLIKNESCFNSMLDVRCSDRQQFFTFLCGSITYMDTFH
ncbi:MAG TPA: hypothetical protein DET40_11020 [Lentisphaeria bacterium]|nr:MAG: hypothetical protein A2X45_20170 [Lentisphaerae bacterium GWF2_50_93]HCE44069.1 hypothetical protein [Lentisphaeria bacterium]